MENESNTLSSYLIYVVMAIIILSIVGIIPVIDSTYSLSKIAFISFGAIALLGAEIFISIKNRKLSHTLRPAHIPVLLICASYLISTYVQSPNPMESWYSKTLLIVALTIIYLISSARLKKIDTEKINLAIIISGAILAVTKIIHSLGLLKNLPLQNITSPLWSLVGSPISLITICLMALSLAFFYGIHTTRTAAKASYLAVAIFMGITVAVTLGEAIVKSDTRFINVPYSVGYSIAIDILKNPRTATMGIGPDNYLAAFSFFKPKAYNNNDLWDIRFASSSNEIFQIFTTNGLIGAIALGLVFMYLGKGIISKWQQKNYGVSIATAIILLSLILFPAQPSTLIALYAIIIIHALSGASTTFEFSNLFYRTTAIGLTSIIGLAGIFWTGRFILADYYFHQSINAISSNKASDALQLQAKAMKNNPYHEEYRVAYSQTNLLIARAIATKEKPTDQDKQTFAALVQESIKFANVAVGLNIQNVNSWENRARILQQVVSFVNGADTEAARSFNNAITLDPNNPRLMVEYGQFLQSRKQINAAIKLFEQAVTLKPNDYANAHYNLASAYETQGRIGEAGIQYATTLKQLKSDNPEYSKIEEKVKYIEDVINKAKNSQTATPSATLNTTKTVTPPTNNPTINTPTDENPQNVSDSQGLLPITPTPQTNNQ